MEEKVTYLLENMPLVSKYATFSGMRFLLDVVHHHRGDVDSNLLKNAYLNTTETVAGVGRLSLVRLMLDGFMRFQLTHEDLESLLVLAANAAIREDKRVVIRYCFNHPDFNPNRLVNNWSPLMAASISGNLFAQKCLLHIPGCKPGIENTDGFSAISYAKQVNNHDGLRILQSEIAKNNQAIVTAISLKLHELQAKVEKKNTEWANRKQLFGLYTKVNDYDDAVYIPIFAQLKTALERNSDRDANKVVEAYLQYASKKYNVRIINYLCHYLADCCPALAGFEIPLQTPKKKERVQPPSLHFARFHAY